LTGPGAPIAELTISPYTEDDLLIEATRLDNRPRMKIYRLPQVVVVLGRGSRVDRELQLERCLEDDVPLLCRRGGGCAVVVDPGNILVAVVLPARGLGGSLRAFDRLAAWIGGALARLGVHGVHREGSSDLALGDRKVGGACIYRARDLLYYAATLLVEPDVRLMARYLRHPPREPAYRRGRAHSEFVGSLSGALGPGATAHLEDGLRRELQGGLEELAISAIS
jgi:lipoate---protein ligase